MISNVSVRLLVGLGLLSSIACTTDILAIVPYPNTSGDDGESESGFEENDGETGADGGQTDLPDDPEPMQAPTCALAVAESDGPMPCELEPLASDLTPTTRWTWSGLGGETSVVVTPLVANLDDDNGDGFVDLCDTPDIVVAAVDLPAGKTDPWPAGHIVVLDGAGGGAGGGARKLLTTIDAAINPALADLDGDGVAEILATQAQGPNSPYAISSRRLVALRADGELMWVGSHWSPGRGGGALAVADLDGDGTPEILAPEYVANADGEPRFVLDDPPPAYSMPVAVDLDQDGQLEVMFGGSAYAEDGTWLFDTPTVPRNRGAVAIANFDDDPAPEYYLQYGGEHAVFNHDGTLVAVCPTGNLEVAGAGGYPVSIRDLDQDGSAELLFGYEDRLYVLGLTAQGCELRWSRKIDQTDGLSSGTAFDLLGDGSAEAIYADRSQLRLYGSTGDLLFQTPHSARESIANPVVADVDGDGAAEIIVVSSRPLGGGEMLSPTLMVLGASEGRYALTRRIWNQHTYHHGNIAELGGVPSLEPDWSADTGFRTNRERSLEPGDACIPPWLAP